MLFNDGLAGFWHTFTILRTTGAPGVLHVYDMTR